MLICEGYRMFHGSADVIPTNPRLPPETITGTWLFKPEYVCWYVNGRSYPAEIVHNIVELPKN